MQIARDLRPLYRLFDKYMSDPTSSRKQVITYIAFVFLFSSAFYFLILRSGSLRSGMGLYVRGVMWSRAGRVRHLAPESPQLL